MSPRNTSARAAALALAAFTLFAMPSPTLAQEGTDSPKVISPLRVEPDRNGVNLTNGKISIDVPTLSVPAAPRLRFDRVQNIAPYILGKINIATGSEYVTANYSIHSGAEASESFTCNQETGCTSVTLSGSAFQTNFGAFNSYRRAGGGEVYTFNLKHVDVANPSQPGSPGTRTVQYYASRITYPDGEVITFTYGTGGIPGDTFNRTFYRPITVSSNAGYYISISYQYTGTDVSVAGWAAPATAAIYKATDPATPLQQLTFAGASITDLGGRVYQISGAGNSLGSDVESIGATVQLPGEAGTAFSSGVFATYPMVGTAVRDGVQWNYTYTNPQFHTGARDYSYDKITVTGPNGYSMAYDVGGQTLSNGWRNFILKQTDALGRATSFAYDGGYRITQVIMPEGNKVVLGYDDCGNIASKTSKAKVGSGLADIVETAAYPAAGPPENLCPNVLSYRPTSSTDALGRQTNYTYSSLGQLTELLDPADASGVRRKTIVTYANSPSGISRKTSVRVCGATTSCAGFADSRTDYTYLGDTLLPLTVTQVDESTGATRTTTNSYDSAGRLLSTDGPLPGTADTQYFRYDVLGRKTWEIGSQAPNGLRLAKRFTYRDSDDKVTLIESGTLTSPTDPNLAVFEQSATTYDARRYPIREATSAGGATHRVTDRSFLDRGMAECTTVRVNLAALPAATSTGACALGTQGSQGPDRITKNLYDNAAQLVQLREGVGTSIEAAEATYSYTLNGKRNYLIDANGDRAQMSYDGFDRQVKWVFPSATRPAAFNDSTPATALSSAGSVNAADFEQYGYDAAGNRTSLRKRDGSTLTYSYDNLNRMIVKIVPERAGLPASATRDVYSSYDIMGRQLIAKFDSQSGADGITNAYDRFGQLTSSTIAMGGFSKTLGHAYDADSRRIQLTHPDGQAFSYVRDALGRVANVYEGISPVSAAQLIQNGYDNRGLIASMQRSLSPGGFITSYGHDPIGRLASLANDAAATTADLTITQGFSPASQIVTQTRNNDAYAWTGAVALSRNYTTNGLNQYTLAGTSGLTYDANGNLTSDGSTTFLYDIENRLVTASGAKTASLTYDPLGRLWQVTSPTTNTRLLYDGDELAAEYDTAGNMTRRYVHSDNADDPVVQYDGASVGAASRIFLMPDERGSIIAAIANDGTLLSRNSYDEYGVPGAGNVGRFQYTGQVWIGELGLYYYKARFYDPGKGRFLQVDPVGYNDQINLYAYVGNDPVNASDPSGMICTGSRIEDACGGGGLSTGRSGFSTASVTGRINDGVRGPTSAAPTSQVRGYYETSRNSPSMRALSTREVDFYSAQFPEKLLRRVTLISGLPWYIDKQRFSGFTLYDRVYLRDGIHSLLTSADRAELGGHELRHVQQYDQGMTVDSYVREAWRSGYRNHPKELDADLVGLKSRENYCAEITGKGC